jgi:hypothetical protein
LYLQYRKQDARGILPAWAADEYLLGRGRVVDTALRAAARAGYLESECEPRQAAAYIREVKAFLRGKGYVK